ncbi:uncharacterized protein LOC141914844 [Tubulanus polymorphus]|uniref:uncharacterized protein LOC141914844 n=1 Tax=Tubulanus polymorphus TaxID=672921 RepID=UPI003DA354A4
MFHLVRSLGVASRTSNEIMKHYGSKTYAVCRVYGPTTSILSRQQTPVSSNQLHSGGQQEAAKIEASWAGVRLSNENGYLSWTRNAYISTICGATMNVQELIVAHSEKAAAVMLFIAFGNITIGTMSFLNYLNWFYRDFKMSRKVYLLQSTLVIIHLLLWYTAILLYFLTFDSIATKKKLPDSEIVKLVMQKKQ